MQDLSKKEQGSFTHACSLESQVQQESDSKADQKVQQIYEAA